MEFVGEDELESRRADDVKFSTALALNASTKGQGSKDSK
jgi:hypothetical protein